MTDVTTVPSNRAVWVFVLVVVLLDQITKSVIAVSMDLHQSWAVLGDWVRITYIRNPGGAFGLRWGHIAVYYLSALLVITWIVLHLRRHGGARRLSVWSLALILGGAIGNLIDRLIRGEVVDFIDVAFFNMHVPRFDIGILNHQGFELDRWPTFNMADSAVTVGVVALLVSLWYDPVIGGASHTPAGVVGQSAVPSNSSSAGLPGDSTAEGGDDAVPPSSAV